MTTTASYLLPLREAKWAEFPPLLVRGVCAWYSLPGPSGLVHIPAVLHCFRNTALARILPIVYHLRVRVEPHVSSLQLIFAIVGLVIGREFQDFSHYAIAQLCSWVIDRM